jgi:hypothetical protein
MLVPSLGMCAPSLVHAPTWHVRALSVRPSPKSNVGVQLPPLSMRIAVFLPSATLWDSWVRPHLACARPHLCTPSLGMCAPSFCMWAPSLGMCAPSSSVPLQKAMSVSNYPLYPCLLLSFCLSLPCGIVGCAHTWHVPAFTWHVHAVTCARPHLACAHPHLAWARPHFACACPHLSTPTLGMCAPSLLRAHTWHVRTLTCARPHLACARPLHPPLS